MVHADEDAAAVPALRNCSIDVATNIRHSELLPWHGSLAANEIVSGNFIANVNSMLIAPASAPVQAAPVAAGAITSTKLQ